MLLPPDYGLKELKKYAERKGFELPENPQEFWLTGAYPYRVWGDDGPVIYCGLCIEFEGNGSNKGFCVPGGFAVSRCAYVKCKFFLPSHKRLDGYEYRYRSTFPKVIRVDAVIPKAKTQGKNRSNQKGKEVQIAQTGH